VPEEHALQSAITQFQLPSSRMPGDVLAAVQRVAVLRPLHSPATYGALFVFGANVVLNSRDSIATATATAVTGLLWAVTAYGATLALQTVQVANSTRFSRVTLRVDGVAYAHPRRSAAAHPWSDVVAVVFVSDVIAVACRGEPLFVSSIWDYGPSKRRHLRQLVDARAPGRRFGDPSLAGAD
jgi:hypothetical protein